jgi:hypothetical protein
LNLHHQAQCEYPGVPLASPCIRRHRRHRFTGRSRGSM